MKKISFFYGLAIQKNPDSIQDMKKAIWVIFYHQISTDEVPRHENCSVEWCEYLKAQHAKISFTHKPALSHEVQEVL